MKSIKKLILSENSDFVLSMRFLKWDVESIIDSFIFTYIDDDNDEISIDYLVHKLEVLKPKVDNVIKMLKAYENMEKQKDD